MPQIKFSHKYQKLLDSHNDVIETATLLQVLTINLEDLSSAFLIYDTDSGKYELPKRGKYLMLIFLKEHTATQINEDDTTGLNLFTTLRRHTPEKHDFYVSQIGKVFQVTISSGASGADTLAGNNQGMKYDH